MPVAMVPCLILFLPSLATSTSTNVFRRFKMKVSNLKKLACITAIVLAPSIAFAGGTQSPDKASTGQSNDPNAEMKAGDMGVEGVGQNSKQDTTIVDDATLVTNVQNALKADPNTQNLDIKAEVSNGVVTLTGVASERDYAIADFGLDVQILCVGIGLEGVLHIGDKGGVIHHGSVLLRALTHTLHTHVARFHLSVRIVGLPGRGFIRRLGTPRKGNRWCKDDCSYAGEFFQI